MTRFLLIVFYIGLSLQLEAQEALGLKLGPYSGVESIFLNPSLSQSSANHWDLTLSAFHGFAYTDYAFLRKSRLIGLSNDFNDASIIDSRLAIPENTNVPLVIFDLNEGDKTISSHLDIHGPAFTISVFDKFKIGAFTKLRGNVSSFDIPENFGIYELNESVRSQTIQATEGQMAFMYWAEIGIHFSTKIEDFNVGVNIKRLQSSEAGYAGLNASETYDLIDRLIFLPPGNNYEFGFTNSSINSESFSPFSNLGNGRGYGLDIGVSYVKDNINAGVALLDFGSVFFDNNVEIYTVSPIDGDNNLSQDLYESANGIRDAIDLLQIDIPVDINVGGTFDIELPTALSMHFATNIFDNYHISANLIQRVPGTNSIRGSTLRRDNTLAVTPSYESKWFSAYAPFVLYEYSRIRMGAAARFGFLTIGTDHLFSTIIKSDFRGSDIYAKISFFPFWERRVRSKSNKKGKQSLDCYTF